MPISFTNNFKNILDKLESVIESEFKGALSVYRGVSIPKGVNQALQLIPAGSVLTEYSVSSEMREYTVNVRFTFTEANVNERALDHILNYSARIEALIHDNISMTLADASKAFNCRFESTEYNTEPDTSAYIVDWVWQCQHQGNLG